MQHWIAPIVSTVLSHASRQMGHMKKFHGILKIKIWNIWDTHTYTHTLKYANILHIHMGSFICSTFCLIHIHLYIIKVKVKHFVLQW